MHINFTAECVILMRNTVSSTAAHPAETYVPTPSPSIARSIPWTTDTPSSFSPNHKEHPASPASLSAHARQLSCLKSGDSRQSRLLVTRFDFSKYLDLLIQVLMLFSAFDPPEQKGLQRSMLVPVAPIRAVKKWVAICKMWAAAVKLWVANRKKWGGYFSVDE